MKFSILIFLGTTTTLAVEITSGEELSTEKSLPNRENKEWKETIPILICKGEGNSGRCFCNSPKDDEIIFGWSWLPFSKNMTCACSRHRHELTRKDVSLHCTENGSYEKLQCDNGMCWCVDKISGKPTERVYPRSMMQHLPCYKEESNDFGNNYHRQCESAAIARETVLRKLEAHGTLNSYIEVKLCDYDGNYIKYKIDRKVIHCVRKNGKQIDLYESDVKNIANTNCNCARDSVLYENENMDFVTTCANNGNYDNPQTINGRQYCVDDYGYATSDLGSLGEILNC